MGTSDFCLSGVKAVSIRLEDGSNVEFNLDEELRIPEDFDELVVAVRTSVSRYGFWKYQAARQRGRVRQLERDYERAYGMADLALRQVYQDEDNDGYTEQKIKSGVSWDKDSDDLRRKLLDELRFKDILDGVADAMRQRCYTITQLSALYATEFSGED